jgi:hypothetical protein
MVSAARPSKPLRVDIPSTDADRPALSRVGIVAAIGFALGIVWPRLLGLEVGPNIPGKAPKPEAGEPTAAFVPAPEAAPDASEEPAAEEPEAKNRQEIRVGDATIESCKTKKGDKIDACGKLALDRTVKSRLADLVRCPAAIGLEGVVHVGIGLNFDKSEVVVLEGKKSELPSSTVKGVLSCAGKALEGLDLEKIPHQHDRYVVSFPVSFYPPGKAPSAEDEATATAEGGAPSAEKVPIAWEKALLRETPKDGKVVARIPQGTRVEIVEQKDDWYLVKSGSKQGWVYRQAIGK